MIARTCSFPKLAVAGLGVFLALTGTGQSSESALKFEVTDVHPSSRSDFTEARGGLMRGGLMRGGRYLLSHATMLDLVRIAYEVDAKKILGGPSWLALDQFDIQAKVPGGTDSASVGPMLRALLAERFGLVVHRDTKPVQAWALSVGRHPSLKPSKGASRSGCRTKESEEFVDWTCRGATMAELISNLLRGDGEAWYYLNDNLVVDQTELTGAWDFDLTYTARWKTAVGGARIVSLFDAIDKLGLKLDAAMVPMTVVVVDRVSRTPTPNSAAAAQAFPPAPVEFEVATLKPANPDYRGDEGLEARATGLVNFHKVTLKSLIATGWGITEDTIWNGPKFLDTERWDIAAKAPDGAIAVNGDDDYEALAAMVKSLVIERFGLTSHFEERTMPALTLTAPKPKLKRANPDSRSGCAEGLTSLSKVDPRSTNPTAARLVTCTNVSMGYLASRLRFLASGYIHSDVTDATGLESGWDLTLSFSKARQLETNTGQPPGAGEATDPNGALSAPEALEKQLGLKLVTRKRPVRVLVIDHIEARPSGN